MKTYIEFVHMADYTFLLDLAIFNVKNNNYQFEQIVLDNEVINPDEQIMKWIMKNITLDDQNEIICICHKKDKELVSEIIQPYGWKLTFYDESDAFLNKK